MPHILSFIPPLYRKTKVSWGERKGFSRDKTYHSVLGHNISWDSEDTSYRKSSSSWLKLITESYWLMPWNNAGFRYWLIQGSKDITNTSSLLCVPNCAPWCWLHAAAKCYEHFHRPPSFSIKSSRKAEFHLFSNPSENSRIVSLTQQPWHGCYGIYGQGNLFQQARVGFTRPTTCGQRQGKG